MKPAENQKKSLKQILKNNDKKEKELSKLNVLFDIALCHCFFIKTKDVTIYKPREYFVYSNCACTEEKKLVNFELYTNQAFEREPILLSEEQKQRFQIAKSGKKSIKKKSYSETALPLTNE